MRRAGAGRVAAALALGLTVSAAAAQEPSGDRPSQPAGKASGWGGWFGGKAKAGDKAAEPAAKSPPSVAAQAARDRDRQEKAFYRRLKVCDRLAEIALQTYDEELGRQAEELAARVFEIYRRQNGAGPADRDQAVLEEHLRTTTARPTWGRAGEEARRAASVREGDE
jgi:hypothetical protein